MTAETLTTTTVRDRVLRHADYLDRQGQQSLASDLRSIVSGLNAVTVLAEAAVSGRARVSPEAIALAGRKVLDAPSARKRRQWHPRRER